MGFSKATDQLSEDVKEYIKLEIDLLKYKAVRELGKAVATVFSYLFLLIFSAVLLMLAGIWLGFWLSSLLDSTTLGFGISAGAFLIAFIVLARFRYTLIEKPFMNTAIRILYKTSSHGEN